MGSPMLAVHELRRPGVALEAFELADGACVAARGPSGAGKTLLRALADLDPNQGEVMLDGLARAAMPAPRWRRRVTYLAAGPAWCADRVGEQFPDWTAAGR
jgi:ABC-type iron transport system FetAB ATPase subunit